MRPERVISGQWRNRLLCARSSPSPRRGVPATVSAVLGAVSW